MGRAVWKWPGGGGEGGGPGGTFSSGISLPVSVSGLLFGRFDLAVSIFKSALNTRLCSSGLSIPVCVCVLGGGGGGYACVCVRALEVMRKMLSKVL